MLYQLWLFCALICSFLEHFKKLSYLNPIDLLSARSLPARRYYLVLSSISTYVSTSVIVYSNTYTTVILLSLPHIPHALSELNRTLKRLTRRSLDSQICIFRPFYETTDEVGNVGCCWLVPFICGHKNYQSRCWNTDARYRRHKSSPSGTFIVSRAIAFKLITDHLRCNDIYKLRVEIVEKVNSKWVFLLET